MLARGIHLQRINYHFPKCTYIEQLAIILYVTILFLTVLSYIPKLVITISRTPLLPMSLKFFVIHENYIIGEKNKHFQVNPSEQKSVLQCISLFPSFWVYIPWHKVYARYRMKCQSYKLKNIKGQILLMLSKHIPIPMGQQTFKMMSQQIKWY